VSPAPDHVWLCILRPSNIGFADSNRQMRNFPGPRVYDISGDDEAIAWARRESKRPDLVLVVSPDEPRLIEPPEYHRLEKTMLDLGTDDRYRIVSASDDVLQDLNAARSETGVPQVWTCACGASYPHPGALERHRKGGRGGSTCVAREPSEIRQRMLEMAREADDRREAELVQRAEREALDAAYRDAAPREVPPWVRS